MTLPKNSSRRRPPPDPGAGSAPASTAASKGPGGTTALRRDPQHRDEPRLRDAPHDGQPAGARQLEAEHPVDVEHPPAPRAAGRELERERQQVQRARGREVAHVAHSGPVAGQLAVEQALVWVGIAREGEDLHGRTACERTPAPKARWSASTRSGPSARLRHAGMASTAGYSGKRSVSGSPRRNVG